MRLGDLPLRLGRDARAQAGGEDAFQRDSDIAVLQVPRAEETRLRFALFAGPKSPPLMAADEFSDLRSDVEGVFTYIVTVTPPEFEAPTPELYDLSKDPFDYAKNQMIASEAYDWHPTGSKSKTCRPPRSTFLVST